MCASPTDGGVGGEQTSTSWSVAADRLQELWRFKVDKTHDLKWLQQHLCGCSALLNLNSPTALF